MLGFNGGRLGVRNVPTTGIASGVWEQNEQSIAKRAAIWPTAGDPDFASVSLLLHMDGSNGSTTFTDSSSNAFTVTANGNAKISTAQSKFGGASGLFDGSGDYVSVASNAAFEVGAGDWTAEAWMRFTGGSDWSFFSTSDNRFRLLADANRWVLKSHSGSDANVFVINWTPTTGVWYHVACCRSGSTTRMFIDGTQIGSGTSSTYTASNSAFNVAGGVAPYEFNGYMDEFRFTKGVARYTANFTPPTAPYANA